MSTGSGPEQSEGTSPQVGRLRNLLNKVRLPFSRHNPQLSASAEQPQVSAVNTGNEHLIAEPNQTLTVLPQIPEDNRTVDFSADHEPEVITRPGDVVIVDEPARIPEIYLGQGSKDQSRTRDEQFAEIGKLTAEFRNHRGFNPLGKDTVEVDVKRPYSERTDSYTVVSPLEVQVREVIEKRIGVRMDAYQSLGRFIYLATRAGKPKTQRELTELYKRVCPKVRLDPDYQEDLVGELLGQESRISLLETIRYGLVDEIDQPDARLITPLKANAGPAKTSLEDWFAHLQEITNPKFAAKFTPLSADKLRFIWLGFIKAGLGASYGDQTTVANRLQSHYFPVLARESLNLTEARLGMSEESLSRLETPARAVAYFWSFSDDELRRFSQPLLVQLRYCIRDMINETNLRTGLTQAVAGKTYNVLGVDIPTPLDMETLAQMPQAIKGPEEDPNFIPFSEQHVQAAAREMVGGIVLGIAAQAGDERDGQTLERCRETLAPYPELAKKVPILVDPNKPLLPEGKPNFGT